MDSKKFVELYKNKGVDGPWAGATGIYMIAPSCPANFYDGESCNNTVPRSVKIGKAFGKGGLASRLMSYNTYWPNGTTVYAVMITSSYSDKYGIIRDYASAREKTLKRVLRRPEVNALGFGSNEKVVKTSEWVRMKPSELIRYFDAVGPKRHPKDRLYTCNSNQCMKFLSNIPITETRQTRAQAALLPRRVPPPSVAANWKALEVVLEHEANLGIPGRPVVLTKAARDLAINLPDHPLHKWAKQLITNQTKQKQLAKRRLQDKEARKIKKADNERKEKLKRILTRKATKKIEMEYQRYKRARAPLPRDLAALENDVKFRYAPKQRLKQPARLHNTRRKLGVKEVNQVRANKVKVKDAFAFDTFGVHLRAASSDSSPKGDPFSDQYYPNQRFRYDRAKSKARKRATWPMDNERLPLKLENAIYTAKEANIPQTSSKSPRKTPRKTPKSSSMSKSCPSRHAIKRQLGPDYTHYNVTGDGRCYFYVILRALGMKLTREKGAVVDLERFFINNSYFNPEQKGKIGDNVRKGTYGNPEKVIHHSPAIRKLLWDRNIRYIATIHKTINTPNIVDEHIQNPIKYLASLSKLHGPTEYKLQSFTAKDLPSHQGAYMNAFMAKQVVTFVHQNYPVKAKHFTVIIPSDIAPS